MQILVFVRGFSTQVATAKTLIFSDLHSRIGILYESAYAGNHCIFLLFTVLILVQGFTIKSAHVGHAYDFCRTDANNTCAFSYKDSL